MADSTTNREFALGAIEIALSLLGKVQVLEGTDKQSVEHFLTVAAESLRKETSPQVPEPKP
jgi:hypothetical protein